MKKTLALILALFSVSTFADYDFSCVLDFSHDYTEVQMYKSNNGKVWLSAWSAYQGYHYRNALNRAYEISKDENLISFIVTDSRRPLSLTIGLDQRVKIERNIIHLFSDNQNQLGFIGSLKYKNQALSKVLCQLNEQEKGWFN